MTTRQGDGLMPRDYAQFYAFREQQARDLAAKAKEPGVSSIHLRMADEYASRINAADSQQATLRIVLDAPLTGNV